jgi:hypothetical protein
VPRIGFTGSLGARICCRRWEMAADNGFHGVSLKARCAIELITFDLRADTIPPPLCPCYTNRSSPKNAALTLEADSVTPTRTYGIASRWHSVDHDRHWVDASAKTFVDAFQMNHTCLPHHEPRPQSSLPPSTNLPPAPSPHLVIFLQRFCTFPSPTKAFVFRTVMKQ